MKTLHLKPFTIALLYALCIMLQSCRPTVSGSWRNEKISSGQRDDFHELTAAALRYLKANDPKGLKTLLSKEMVAVNTEREVELISNRLNDNPYTLLDEYYVVNKYRDTDTVASKSGAINRYGLIYPAPVIEMYFAFFVPKKPANKYMVSLVYAKFNYGWKIIRLDLEPYTINGKTAPELFALAKDQYDKKQLQAALNNVTLAVACFKPFEYWQYPEETEAGLFYTKVHREVNEKYQYPLVLHQLATGPMVLRVYTKNADNDGGTFPLIYYMTHFSLKDTNEVKKENMEIRSAISKIMPGLDENNKCIFYSAFNVQPTGYNTVAHFDMVDKLH